MLPPPQLQDITFNNESIISKDAVILEQSLAGRTRDVSELSALPTPSSDSSTKVPRDVCGFKVYLYSTTVLHVHVLMALDIKV